MRAATTVRTIKMTNREQAEMLMRSYTDLARQKKEKEKTFKNEKENLDQQLEAIAAQLQDFALKNEKEFNGKKSLNLESGTIGWKLATGKLEFALNADQEGYEKLIRTKYKDALETKINTANVVKMGKLSSKLKAELAELGITIKQEDSFFVTPAH